MHIACIIASQSRGSNHGIYRERVRSETIKGTLRSVYDTFDDYVRCNCNYSTKLTVVVSYNGEGYDFSDFPDLVLLPQTESRSQFRHIESAWHRLQDTCADIPDVACFMDDDDMVATSFFATFLRWYQFTRMDKNNFVWHPNRATFAGSMTHLDDIAIFHPDDHRDFPGTIIPWQKFNDAMERTKDGVDNGAPENKVTYDSCMFDLLFMVMIESSGVVRMPVRGEPFDLYYRQNPYQIPE
jgi:hypothetical protein